MKTFRKYLRVITLCLLGVLLTACPDSDGEEVGGDDITTQKTAYDLEVESILEGTTWRCTKEESINYNLQYKGRGIITFGYGGVAYFFDMEKEAPDWYGEWYVKDKKLWMIPNSDNKDYARRYLAIFGLAEEIVKLTDTEMIIGTSVSRYYYTKQKYKSGNDGGGSSNDVPYVTGFDYTATKTSIKVSFRVNSRPTSASIYYGENSANKSAGSPTIVGTTVTATVNGLKSGTKYYFKCTVKNSKGSSTSDDWPAMTQY